MGAEPTQGPRIMLVAPPFAGPETHDPVLAIPGHQVEFDRSVGTARPIPVSPYAVGDREPAARP